MEVKLKGGRIIYTQIKYSGKVFPSKLFSESAENVSMFFRASSQFLTLMRKKVRI